MSGKKIDNYLLNPYDEQVATIYVRLKHPEDTVYFQSILGTYSHLAWIRTENGKEGIIRVISTNDLIDEARGVLISLKAEIEFEEVEI